MAHRPGFVLRQSALAAALCCMALQPAWAVVSATGDFNVYPIFISPGPGDTDLGANTLGLGGSGVASLLVNNGSFLSAASIRFGDGGTGVATASIDGVGTRVNIAGDGNTNRLELGAWGRGTLTVSGGATLDGRANSGACLLGNQWCNNFIGNAAGSEALLTITGAGSNASFLRAFVVGGLAVFRPPIDNFTFGTPGGSTRGRVEVLDGGTLTTDGASIGVAPGGSSPLGTERSFAEVVVNGANSQWRITGNGALNQAAFITTATHANASATITISNGGKMLFEGPTGLSNGMNLTQGGGRTDLTVTGLGSQLAMASDTAVLQIGRNGGSAAVRVLDQASMTGLNYISVGRNGSMGELLIDGANSLVSVTGTASAAALGGGATQPGVASMDIGRDGIGSVTVRNGGQLLIGATTAGSGGPNLSLGRGATATGTLAITGAGSTVTLSALSTQPGGGATEAFNPNMRIGRDGVGTLTITQGAKLLIDGQAVSTAAHSRNTLLTIGGSSNTTVGGTGTALINGPGSEVRMTGSDTILRVGTGLQSVGQLTMLNQASASAMGLLIGDAGGTGVLRADNATLSIAGQQTGDALAGAFVVIGNGLGAGAATLANGSVLTISNPGTAGAGLFLGGTSSRPGGTGTLSLTGASQVNVSAGSGLARLHVGREGSGSVDLRGASSINLGDGQVAIARLAGSVGSLQIRENSTVNAGWVGVGRELTGAGDVDGGIGTLLLTNGNLHAQTIVIGSKGYLGGTGTITGNITNHGTFAPGNSPGTLEIDGSFTALAGSKMVLEVESDGAGGFLTDLVIFKGGQPLDLANLNAEFRFLGTTDPNAFGGSGLFKLDTFFQERQADNSLAPLAPALFDNAMFSAQADGYQITSFSFSPATGGSVIAAAVPEPEAWALMLAGLFTIGAIARRRSRAARG